MASCLIQLGVDFLYPPENIRRLKNIFLILAIYLFIYFSFKHVFMMDTNILTIIALSKTVDHGKFYQCFMHFLQKCNFIKYRNFT